MSRIEVLAPLVSIVMTYFERPLQLQNTLYSFVRHGYGKGVEVIVVDDGSIKQPAVRPLFPFDFNLAIFRIPPEQKRHRNSCVPFNLGFAKAAGRIVLIQNAECCHYGDIISDATLRVGDHNYVSYSCYSLDSQSTTGLWDAMHQEAFWSGFPFSNTKPSADGAAGWYNHPTINPTGYHFCAGITRRNLERLGGFDEKYAAGVAFDDNELLHRIKALPLEIAIADEAVALHQFHYTKELLESRAGDYYERNKALYKYFTLGGRTLLSYVAFVLMFYVFNRQKFRRLLVYAKKSLLQAFK